MAKSARKKGPDTLAKARALKRSNPFGAARLYGKILNRDPENVHAIAGLRCLTHEQRRMIFQRAAAMAQAGTPDLAAEGLVPLARACPDDPHAVNLGARLLLGAGQGEAALCLLAPALAASPNEQMLRAAQGAVLYGTGQLSEARSALMRAGQNCESLNLLGRCCDALGDGAGARAAYAAALEAPGDPSDAWFNISAHVDFSREAKLLHALDTACRKAPPGSGTALMLGLARAKAHEDCNEIDDSFACLAAVNAHIAAARPLHRIEDRRQHIAHARARVHDLPAPAGPLPPAPRPVLIVGMPRSGTTLVEHILARHHDVTAGGELDALQTALAPCLDPGATIAPDMAAASARAYGDALRTLADGTGVVTDKMPGNVYLAGHALRLFPEARVIWVRRHPIATAFSCFRTHFGRGNDWSYQLDTLAEEVEAVEHAMQFWQHHFPGRVQTLLYEHLTEDPEAGIAQLLSDCDLPFDPACLGTGPTATAVRTASATQVRKPIYRGSSELWRRYSDHLGPLLERLGAAVDSHEAALRDARRHDHPRTGTTG